MDQQVRQARLHVWGDHACFTRPETRTERLSYPFMTPSAARGVLEAILYRPQFYWAVREIWLLRPIQYFSETRNEVADAPFPKKPVREPWNSVTKFYKTPYATERHRLQRHTCGLRDVAYAIIAEPICGERGVVDRNKYLDMFDTRVHQGACFHQPSFGQRDWVAYFAPLKPDVRPLAIDMQLGRMLFDQLYQPMDRPGPAASVFFAAKLTGGIMHVPAELYTTTRPYPQE